MAYGYDGITLGGGGTSSSSHFVIIGPGQTYSFGGAYGASVLGPPPLPWTVINYGLITATGSGSTGLWLQSGGTVVNAGTIGGRRYGVNIPGGAGLVTNTGVIAGTYENGGAGV